MTVQLPVPARYLICVPQGSPNACVELAAIAEVR